MATVSYGLKIINAYPVFDATLRIYRAAVRYLMEIAELRYEELLPITGYVCVSKRKTGHLTAGPSAVSGAIDSCHS